MLNHQRADLAPHLRYKPDVAGRVREMMRREEACCAFLSFDFHEQADAVLFTIRAPEAAREVADTLFDRFVAMAR